MRRRDATARVWPLAGGLLATAAGLYVLFVRPLEGDSTGVTIPWWALIGVFALVDACMVHLQFRRERHSFTLAEFPLVFGLFFADPLLLVPARLAGAMLALVLVRKQRPIKLAFNLAVFALEACVAILVFHAIAAPGVLSWRSMTAALAGLVLATILGAMAVVTAISLTEGRLRATGVFQSLGLGLVVTLANGSIALIGVAIVSIDWRLAVLLLAPAVVLLLAYRAYLAEQKRRASLEFLYRTTQELHTAHDIGTAVQALLTATRDAFRADIAEIVLAPTTNEPARRTTLGPGDRIEVEQPVEASEGFGPVDAKGAVLVSHDDHIPGTGHWRASVGEAMIAPLSGDRRLLGRLTVRDRLGDVGPFDTDDLRLFETLANHAGVALEVIALADELRHQAFHDSLTHLPNRALLHQHLESVLARGVEPGSVAVLVLDLDDFKTINDSLGHAAGDDLLVAFTERLCGLLRPGERVARLGGDEFAVVLDAPHPNRVDRIAGEILQALDEPFTLEGKQITVSASIGIAFATARSKRPHDLLRNADLAMYKAKESGKDRTETFEARLHDRALRRLEMRRDLREALDRDEFVLHYQPIVELQTGEVAGLEALVRWQHPDRGLLAPGAFLPMLEETDLIVPLGGWVLREALRQVGTWRQQGHDRLGISVNLSAVQLRRPELVDYVARAIAESAVIPHAVTLELTESAFLDNLDPAGGRLGALKQLGIKLAIDDFGTGYSSLAYLSRFPIDQLKIAREFVTDSGTPALGQAIVGIASSLGLECVAEGIETERERDRLSELGCRLGQGYLFARPAPAEDVSALLEQASGHFAGSRPRGTGEVVPLHAQRRAGGGERL